MSNPYPPRGAFRDKMIKLLPRVPNNALQSPPGGFSSRAGGVLISDALAQLVLSQFSVCLRRWHTIDKPLNVAGEVLVAVSSEIVGESAPAAFDLAPCFHKLVLTEFDAAISFE